MSHCNFCLQLCQVRPVRKQLSSLLPDSPACLWLPPALLSPLLKHSLLCCVCVSFIGHISQDQTSMEDVWVMPFGIPLMKPFLTGPHGWLEHRLLLVHGLSTLPLSFLGFGQHLSFLLFRTPDSVWVTFCRLPQYQRWTRVWPLAMGFVSEFVLPESIHAYVVIVHSVVPENPKGQRRCEWLKVTSVWNKSESKGKPRILWKQKLSLD